MQCGHYNEISKNDFLSVTVIAMNSFCMTAALLLNRSRLL